LTISGVWVDANHDGYSQPQELHALPELGIGRIGLQIMLSPEPTHSGTLSISEVESGSGLDQGSANAVGPALHDGSASDSASNDISPIAVCLTAAACGLLGNGRSEVDLFSQAPPHLLEPGSGIGAVDDASQEPQAFGDVLLVAAIDA
jgi:hypothetical protein